MFLELEKQDYSDYAKGFYTSQLDNLAKAFAVPSNTASLTEFAEQSIASMKEKKTKQSVLQKKIVRKLLMKNLQKAQDKPSKKKLMILKKLLGIIQKSLHTRKY